MENIKEIKKIFLKIIIFILIFSLIWGILTIILVPKWKMTYMLKGFYKEPKNSIDVLFMGSSNMYKGVSPVKLWDEYGITSYNYSAQSQRMWVAYYMLQESLKYQKPKVLVLDVDSVFRESKNNENQTRKVFDNLKLSKNKIEMINDPVFEFSLETKLTYIFPLLRYHSRWNDLKKVDFTGKSESEKFIFKGMNLLVDEKPYKEGNAYMNSNKHNKKKIGPTNDKYLTKIIETCKENNIELILVEIPSGVSWSQNLSDKVNKFAVEHNTEFIDINQHTDEMGFDWNKDTSDAGEHLNVYGAEKVTSFLGKILKSKYDLPDRRLEEEYKSWNEVSKKYHDIKEMLMGNKIIQDSVDL